ncbi:MAG: hypothetical protein HY399_04670 [Elusimicrobia bacterium]|nr:hypothetical protein [Elusimicrobiota bacterium]
MANPPSDRKLPITIGLEFFKALNLYFTPFAISLIVLGLIILPEIPKNIFYGSMITIALTLLFNMGASSYVYNHPETWQKTGYIRMWINLVLNAVFYWMLAPYWEPVWLLLALGPIAMALYGDEDKTAWAVGVVAVILLVHRFLKETSSPLLWGESITQIGFILLLSLFIHRIGRIVKNDYKF